MREGETEATSSDTFLGGRYRLLRRAGAGACGEVFLARDEELERPVAIKQYRVFPGSREAAALARFEREAALLARHPHDAIVPIFDLDLRQAPPYVVLRWMEGGDLTSRILQGARAPDEVAALGLRLAGALAHLHGQDIVHRDVKPENILLDEAGEAYLADLGLADALEEERLTATGMIVGTPRYMAPELFEGSSCSAASDLFSLGLVLLEVALGERLDYLAAQDGRRLQADLRRIADPGLRRALRAALRSVAAERIPDARALGGQLSSVLDGDRPTREAKAGAPDEASTQTVELPSALPPVADVGGGSTARSPRGGLPWAPTRLLGVLLLLLLLVAGWGWWPRPAPPPSPHPGPAPGGEAPELVELSRTIDELAGVGDRLVARRSQFRRERRSNDTDSRDLFVSDGQRLTDASVGLLWARHLRAAEGFLRAVRSLPDGKSYREASFEVWKAHLLGEGRDFFRDLRRFELRAGGLVMRGWIRAAEVGHWARLANARIQEIGATTRAWVDEAAARGLAGDPGLVALEAEYLTAHENVDLLLAAERMLDVAAAHPEHALLPALYQAAGSLLDRLHRSAEEGLVSIQCRDLEATLSRYHRQRIAHGVRGQGAAYETLESVWACPESEGLQEQLRAQLPQIRRRAGGLGRRRSTLCREAVRRLDGGSIPEETLLLTREVVAAGSCR